VSRRTVVGVWVWFSYRYLASSASDYLESSVQIGCVVPRLLTHLSPGDGMISDEGIMAHPIG
jgi:hypothetical protein